MAQLAVSLNPAAATRTRAIWIPREHGAWGMLLVPLLTGAAVGAGVGSYVALLWFTIAAVSLFWLRTPVESVLGTTVVRVRTSDERRAAMIAVAGISAVSLIALTALFRGFQHLGLIVIGSIAGLAFALQAIVKNRNRRYRALAQVIGAIGLTSTSASAFYLASGKWNATAAVLWVLNWLFAAEQILFVQQRIHGVRLATTAERFERAKPYIGTVTAILIAVSLLSLCKLAPAWTPLAFTPALVRALVWFRSRPTTLDVHRLGWLELANSSVFAILIVLTFRTR